MSLKDPGSAIAVIGAGNVGARLGRRLAASGYDVSFGVRNPSEAGDLAAGAGARAMEPAKAAALADVIFLAVPAGAAVDVARGLGDLASKIVVDCTNPLRWDGGPVWAPPREGSVTAALAAALPGVAVVKGFNHFGAEIHADPHVSGGPADAFFAGDDQGAKRRVMEIANTIGFRAIDAGPLRNAALLENLAVLWIHLAGSGAGRRFAFRI